MAAANSTPHPQQQPSTSDIQPQSKEPLSETRLQSAPSSTPPVKAQDSGFQASSQDISTTPAQQKQNIEEIERVKSKTSWKAEDVLQGNSKMQFNDAVSDEQRGIAPEAAPNIQERQREREKQEEESMKQQPTEETLVKQPSTTASEAEETTAAARVASQKAPSAKAKRRTSTTARTTKTAASIIYADPVKLVRDIEFKALTFIVSLCASCFLLGRWNFGILMLIATVTAVTCAYWYFGKESDAGSDWRLDKQENLKALYMSEGETVEWLNYILEKFWRSIDTEFFDAIQGYIEEQIKAVLPGFIKAIEIADLDIGAQAPRVQMIRVFPPLPGQSEESIFGEASFSFHAHPAAMLTTARGRLESTPPGVTVRMQPGSLSVRGELTALTGKIRFKLITGPELPFVSKCMIAFQSPPQIETAVMPLTRHINLMHLPMLKQAVNEGVRLALADMVDPKMLTLDVRELMGNVGKDTDALGVVRVDIREARADPSSKIQEIEDSYATIALSHQPQKSMSSTRVLTNDKDPRWNETLYVLINQDDVAADNRVDIKVWDADKVKYDDMWGSFSLSTKEIVKGEVDNLGNITNWCQEERVVYDGWAPLDGSENVDDAKFKINFKMTFHPKYPTPDPEMEKKMKKKKPSVVVDPDHNSGILSVMILQAMDLSVVDPESVQGGDESKHPYNANQVVSPYALLYINDSKVYQSRSKLRNPSPHWNAKTEHFIKDFNTTTLRVVVKTSLELERDPVLGTRCIKLSETFSKSNHEPFQESQTWLVLQNGVGSGKVLLTLKYKPIKLSLPPQLCGTSVGTLIVDSVRFLEMQPPFQTDKKELKVMLALNVDPVIIKRLKARDYDPEFQGWEDKHFYFPLFMRMRSALYLHVTQSGLRGKTVSGRLWLREILDDDWQEVEIHLGSRYIPEHSKEANRNEDNWDDSSSGRAVVRMRIVPGFSPVHTHLRSFDADMTGADIFKNERLKAKALDWIQNQSKQKKEQQEGKEEEESKHAPTQSGEGEDDELSEEYGDEEELLEEDDEEAPYVKEMTSMSRDRRVSKYQVLRKVQWGTDFVKQKVDTIREGFNSEARLSRQVAKEI